MQEFTQRFLLGGAGTVENPLHLFQRRTRDRQVQMLGQDFIAAAHQQRKVNDVFQLTGITRPTVVFKHPLGGVADQRHRQVQALAVDTQEVLGQ